MQKISLPSLEKLTSQLGLGFESWESLDQAATVLDPFLRAGGNLFDTAHVYREGVTESIFGQWHVSRGIPRESFVLIGKGAHTPDCYPKAIAREMGESLDRLKTDHIDIYFMHRDNPDIPVGEFVDAIAAEIGQGHIRGLYGGSNWTMQRFDEAVAYARKTGKPEPAALSNQFSLAEMIEPPWPGCLSASSGEWRDWLKSRNIPNFAWSSQAHGFFTDRAGREKRDEPEFMASWYSESNFERRDRAISLAGKLGVQPVQIALAYVLALDLPVVPLVGPRTYDELTACIAAIDIELTPEQVAWLEG